MHYMLFYDYDKDVATKRAPFREAHLALLQRLHKEGVVLLAGAFGNPLDGAAIIFKCDTPADVERYVKADPYVINGLVPKWRIREWNVGVGGTV